MEYIGLLLITRIFRWPLQLLGMTTTATTQNRDCQGCNQYWTSRLCPDSGIFRGNAHGGANKRRKRQWVKAIWGALMLENAHSFLLWHHYNAIEKKHKRTTKILCFMKYILEQKKICFVKYRLELCSIPSVITLFFSNGIYELVQPPPS